MAAAAGRYVTVYLLDDHDIVRQGLRDLLAPAREVHVVGDSGRAEHAAEAILERGAMVMVLDLQLQDGSGVHVCRQVRAVNPNVQGLLLTSADDDAALAAAVLAGAAGCLVKLTQQPHPHGRAGAGGRPVPDRRGVDGEGRTPPPRQGRGGGSCAVRP